MIAHVKVRMNVTNSDGYTTHWANNMRVKARLTSPGAALGSTQWRTTRFPAVSELAGGYHTKIMAVNTDGVSPSQDWILETKLIWDRTFPIPDHVEHFKSKFPGCGDGLAIGVG